MRKLRLIVCAFALILTLSITVSAAVECTGLRSYASAAENGKISVQLTLTCLFQETQNSLQLALPEDATNIVVYNYRSKVSHNKVDIQADSVFTGTQSFRIDYCIKAAKKTEQELPLLLPLIPKELGLEVGYVEFALDLPKTYQEEPAFLVGDTERNDVLCMLDDKRIAGTLQQQIAPGDGLILSLTLPKDYFAVQHGGIFGKRSFWSVLTVLVFLLTVIYWYWTIFRNSHRLRAVQRPLPPDGVNAGEMPCLISGSVGDPAALLTEWASRGYLEFISREGGTACRMRMRMGTERPEYERKLFARFFRDNDVVQVGSSFYQKCAAMIAKRLRQHWESRLFDRKSGSPAILRFLCVVFAVFCIIASTLDRGVLLVLPCACVGAVLCVLVQRGVLALIRNTKRLDWLLGAAAVLVFIAAAVYLRAILTLAALLLQILCGIAVCFGGRRTELGMEKLEQAWGLRKFLQNANMRQLRAQLQDDAQYFYRMLPYAEALGFGKTFANSFGTKNLEPCSWMQDAGVCTAQQFYSNYRSLVVSLRQIKEKH